MILIYDGLPDWPVTIQINAVFSNSTHIRLQHLTSSQHLNHDGPSMWLSPQFRLKILPKNGSSCVGDANSAFKTYNRSNMGDVASSTEIELYIYCILFADQLNLYMSTGSQKKCPVLSSETSLLWKYMFFQDLPSKWPNYVNGVIVSSCKIFCQSSIPTRTGVLCGCLSSK